MNEESRAIRINMRTKFDASSLSSKQLRLHSSNDQRNMWTYCIRSYYYRQYQSAISITCREQHLMPFIGVVSSRESENYRETRKPSYRWLTRATRKPAKNCSNSTCLQRCRWQYWPIFIRLAVVAFEMCEIPRNSLKIQAYKVQGHPRSSILVSIESPYVTCY